MLMSSQITDDASSESGASLASSTTSVTSSILEYRLENGRTYHKYKDGSSTGHLMMREKMIGLLTEAIAPEKDLVHNLYLRTFDDRLGTAPPNDSHSKVGRVLDVGTGSGIWANDFGDEHPEADVIGIDLSASQPSFTPPNVRFEIDDIEEPWTFSQPFDYIHSRMMKGSIRDWQTYLKRCFDNLNPGGYLELNDVDGFPTSDDGTLTEDCNLMKAFRLCFEALAALGSPFEEFSRFESIMTEIGFEDVHIRRFKWPTNSWPKDQRHKELDIWNHENLAPHLDGLLMAPLTRALNWTSEEVSLLAMEARKDLANRSIHAYFNIWSIHGRKPLKTRESQDDTSYE
ncbi:methyltransferase domain-containing protein [Colletotrichum incanum]|nr:methyltransferase domain-containing protein [Colletotrichum incanum]